MTKISSLLQATSSATSLGRAISQTIAPDLNKETSIKLFIELETVIIISASGNKLFKSTLNFRRNI